MEVHIDRSRCSRARRLKPRRDRLVKVGKGNSLRASRLGFGRSWRRKIIQPAVSHETRLLVLIVSAIGRIIVVIEGRSRRLRL